MSANPDVVRRYVEATSAGDQDAAAGLTAEGVLVELPDGTTLRGRDGARVFAAKHAEADGCKQSVHLTALEPLSEDRFLLTLVMSSREVATDELLYSMEVGSVIEMGDGLITRHQVLPSPEEAAAAAQAASS